MEPQTKSSNVRGNSDSEHEDIYAKSGNQDIKCLERIEEESSEKRTNANTTVAEIENLPPFCPSSPSKDLFSEDPTPVPVNIPDDSRCRVMKVDQIMLDCSN